MIGDRSVHSRSNLILCYFHPRTFHNSNFSLSALNASNLISKCLGTGNTREEMATYATAITRPMNAKPRLNGRRHEVVEYCRSTVTKISLDNRWIRVSPRFLFHDSHRGEQSLGPSFIRRINYPHRNPVNSTFEAQIHSWTTNEYQTPGIILQAVDINYPRQPIAYPPTVANIIKLKDGKWNVSTITSLLRQVKVESFAEDLLRTPVLSLLIDTGIYAPFEAIVDP